MSAPDHSQRSDALFKVFRKHFPGLTEIEAARQARDLSSSLSSAKSFEFLERADIDPKKDKKELEAAARAAKKANKHLLKIGTYGSLCLYDALWAAMKSTEQDDPSIVAPMRDSSVTLREKRRFINTMAMNFENALSIASETINLDERPFSSLFSGDPETAEFRKGKPKKTAADLYSRKCGHVYFLATGKEPKVPDKDGVAYGPFLDFITDAFEAVKMNASPQVWANKVDKEFSKPK